MNIRVLFLLSGILVICLSIILVGYAMWPLQPYLQQATLPSTLFLPP